MVFAIGVAAVIVTAFVIGAVAVIAYVADCSQLQLTLRSLTPIRNSEGNTLGEISRDELLGAVFDRRD